MKTAKTMRKALCALALAACLSLAACTLALPPQPTLDELLAEVNAAHQAVQRPQVDAEQYMREGPDEETVARFTEGELTAFNADAELTAAQAAEDVEYLFEAFRTLYGPYEYFGGDETFGAHKAELLARLAEKDSWTAAEVQDLLLEGLRFFQDGHFNINGGKPNLPKVPFFFREAAFCRTEEGYLREDGKRVASVDGYEDLDELFKRSISPEGEIVYYPVLLKEWTMTDQPQPCDEQLTVRYADGSSQTLTAEPFQRYSKEIDADNVTEFYKNGEIPVFVLNLCDDAASDEADAAAIMVARSPVGIVDLRTNPGGSDAICNHSGAQVASAAYHIQLPHSRCVVTMGHGLFTVPQDWDYYEELRGYEPDLWVPAAEAEELAVRLMERLGAVGTPQD